MRVDPISEAFMVFCTPLAYVFNIIIILGCSLWKIEAAWALMGISMAIELVYVVAYCAWYGKAGTNIDTYGNIILFLLYKIYVPTFLLQVLSLILVEYIIMCNLTCVLFIAMLIGFSIFVFQVLCVLFY